MAVFILKRIFISIILIFIISLFAFSLMHILPGDPARMVLGEDVKQEDIDRLREKLNLNKPLTEQYYLWIKGMINGDFGYSIMYSRPVGDILAERLPRTLSIGIPAIIIAAVVGILLGVVSAIKRGSWIDQFITLLSTIGIGTPTFWIGILGIFFLGMKLKLLPIQGFVNPSENFLEYIRHAAMPVFCLAIALVASVVRQTRSNMLDEINQDYVRTARANGIKRSSIFLKHSLKNALIPIVTVIALQVRIAIGGALIIEAVFNIAGMGQLIRLAVLNRDYLIVQGVVFVIALVIVCLNSIVDILYGLIDPQIRLVRGKL